MQEKSGQLALFALTTCILPLITPELMLVRATTTFAAPQTPHDSHPETDDGTHAHAHTHHRTRTRTIAHAHARTLTPHTPQTIAHAHTVCEGEGWVLQCAVRVV